MPFTPPANQASILPTLSEKEQRTYNTMLQAAMEVSTEKPYVDMSVITHYMGDYLNAAQEHHAIMDGYRARSAMYNVPIGPAGLAPHSELLKQKFQDNFANSTLPKYGAPGQEAWTELSRKMHGDGFIADGMKQIHNTEKGGWQIPGIVAAVAVVAGAVNMFGLTGLVTDVVKLGGTLLLAATGAWAANKAVGMIGMGNKNEYAFPGTGATSPGQSPGLTRNQSTAPTRPIEANMVAGFSAPPAGFITPSGQGATNGALPYQPVLARTGQNTNEPSL